MRQKIVFVLLIIAVFILNTGCTGKKKQDDVHDVQIIKWATMDIYSVNEEAVAKVNQMLQKMGYSCSIEFVTFQYDDYVNSIKEYEKLNGPFDIVNTGIGVAGNGRNDSYDLIREGYFMPLSAKIAKDDQLYQMFAQKQWDRTKVDNELYTIPSNISGITYLTYYFNKKCFSPQELSTFDGTIENLNMLLTKIQSEEISQKLLYELDFEYYTSIIDCAYINSFIVSYNDMKLYNPLKYQPMFDYMNTLDLYKHMHSIKPKLLS